MNSFEHQAYNAPPPSPFIVLSRHGKQGKLKVKAYGAIRIMSREAAIKYARGTRKLGGMVSLGGIIREDEIA